MSDEKANPTKPSMPAQPTTKALPAMTDRALLEDLARTVKEGFVRLDDKVDTLTVNVEILQDDGRDTKARLIRLEGWKEHVDDRMSRNSARVKEPSQHDLEAKAELAKEREAREALEKKVNEQTALITANNEWTKSLVDDGRKFFKAHPQIGTAAVLVILGILHFIAKKFGVEL